MPELPEVENIVRALRPKLCGKLIKEVEVAHHGIIAGTPRRISDQKNSFSRLIRNKKIKGLSRKGKCIVFDLSNGYELGIHLGMTGQLLYRQKGGAIDRHTRMVFYLNDNLHELRFADMRRFGWVSLRRPGEDKNAYLDNLGPDALTLDLKGFKTRLSNRTGTVKGFLLNQHIISGLGNIYTDESLYRAGIHPQRKVNTLTEHEIKILHKAIGQILKEAIVCGGSTVSTYRLPDGKEGEFQRQHKVYQRQGRPCPQCKTPIARIKVAGRGTYFCPKCQGEN